ncbi:MAG: hypothetical protein LBE35_00700 [Clostridiales bacterium]|nr:hypothetical protein [Clostridiales bacterium]
MSEKLLSKSELLKLDECKDFTCIEAFFASRQITDAQEKLANLHKHMKVLAVSYIGDDIDWQLQYEATAEYFFTGNWRGLS